MCRAEKVMADNIEKQLAAEDVIAIDAIGLGTYLDAHPACDKLIEKINQAINQVFEREISESSTSICSKPPRVFNTRRLGRSARLVIHNKLIADIVFDDKLQKKGGIKKAQDEIHVLTDVEDTLPTLSFTDPQYLREQLLETANWLAAEEVSRRAGSNNINASALPNRWKKAEKVFAITSGNKDLFPEYIFGDDGKPLLAVSTILKCFDNKKSIFKIALWFASNNSWLDGKAPKDILCKDASAVINAAEKEVTDNVLG
jgi:hypothetical protein